jgi:hypothetical protein
MRYGKLILAAAVAGFTMITTLGGSTAKEMMAPPEATASASLAASLAQYGLDKHDPASLLAAAHIINGLKANVAKPMPAAAGAKPESYDPMMLLKTAKTYATGANAALAAAIDGEMKNVSSTQAVCYYQYYLYYGYYYYRYVCY